METAVDEDDEDEDEDAEEEESSAFSSLTNFIKN